MPFEETIKQSVENLDLGERWSFQQDSGPKPTAKVVKNL